MAGNLAGVADNDQERQMKRSIGMLIGILVVGLSGVAHSVPLSSRPLGTPGPHLFGYFASNNQYVGAKNISCSGGNAADCSSLLTELGTHSNVVNILGDDNWVVARLTAAQAAGMGAVVFVEGTFCATTGSPPGFTNPLTLWSDAASRWASLKSKLAPFVSSGTIVALHIGEEPPVRTDPSTPSDPNWMARATMITMKNVANMVKADFPHLPVMLEFTAWEMDQTGWSATNTTGFTIDPVIDWIGYDCYNPTAAVTFTNCYGDTTGALPVRAVPYYMGRLKTIARAGGNLDGHGIVLFPNGHTQDVTASSQDAVMKRVEREAAMADNDPAVVMVMPFLWDPGDASAGVAQMGSVKTYYSAWGLHATTPNSPRRAYPVISANFAVTSPIFGFDYDTNNVWNSGVVPSSSPYILGSFPDPIQISALNLIVDQSPNGFAQHVITGAHLPNGGSPFTLSTPSGNFVDGATIPLTFSPTQVTSQVKVATTSNSPTSWVAWRDIQPWTTGSTRVYAYPRASSSGASPEFVSDGDPTTVWNSGTAVPASIDLDLGQAQTISLIQLVVAQSPAGPTEHGIYGGPSLPLTGANLLTTVTGTTHDNDTLTVTGPFTNIRYLRIYTVSSPSWVAWREISVFK